MHREGQSRKQSLLADGQIQGFCGVIEKSNVARIFWASPGTQFNAIYPEGNVTVPVVPVAGYLNNKCVNLPKAGMVS